MTERMTQRIPTRESELREPVERLFSRDEYDVGHEVRFGLKRIDLFFWRGQDSSEIIAVELKLRDWRRAVWQAVHNRQVAIWSYIALPAKSLNAVDSGILKSLGLGLISVSPDSARIYMRAKRSRVFNQRVAERILCSVRQTSDV
jgi:hypothetical protein